MMTTTTTTTTTVKKMNHYYFLGRISLTLFLLSSVITRCSVLETGPLLLRRAGEANSVDDSDTLLYVAPVCDDTGISCVWECPWTPDDDYQWCGHCGYFLRCRRGRARLIPCPREAPLWDNIAKKCQDHTLTCLCTGAKDPTTKTTPPAQPTTEGTSPVPETSTQNAASTESTETSLVPETSTQNAASTESTETSPVPETSTQNAASTESTETPEPITTVPPVTTVEIPTITSSKIPDTTGTKVTETPGPATATETGGPTIVTVTQGPATATETGGPTIVTVTQGPATATETGGPTIVTETQGPATATETGGPTIVTETQGPATATETGGPTIVTETQRPATATETGGPITVTETQGPTINGTIGPTITETQGPTINGTIGPTITETQGPTINGTIGPTITETQGPTINGTIGPTITETQGPTINGTIGPTITETQGPTINGTIGPTITETRGPTINGTITETPVNTTETFSPTWNETSSNATEATANFTAAASTSPSPSTQNPADRDEYIEGTVYLDPFSGAVTYKLGKMDKKKGTLYGFYNNTIHRTGWGVLEIKANALCREYKRLPPFNIAGRMYAAGFLEGLLTARQIWEHYLNTKSQMYSENATLNAAVREFVKSQDKWTRAMIEIQRRRRDPYWMNVEHVVNQLDGLHAGYKVIAKTQGWDTDFHVVQMINLLGDLPDLKKALGRQSSTLALNRFNIGGRCSALIKLTPGFENIFIGHSTWFVYGSTLRIYKHYSFPFLRLAAGSTASSFSSYPGNLGSLDDFYLTDAGLGVMETTNSIYNRELYKKVIPESLFTWQRAIIANRMARTGKGWFYFFQQFNSGTYNNQFMIIDFKRISLNKVVEDDALWIIEQIPGLVKGADQTSILRAGYWPSYNIPFYEEIYEKSGYDKAVALLGPEWSYQLAPRAKIFRREAGKITNITSFMDLLRDNDYLDDEYSKGDPSKAICARYDLDPYETAFGCYDTKVADYNMSRELTSVVFSGPTTSHGLKPFSWRGKWQNESHIGLPDTYDFSWIPMSPSLT